LENNQHIKELYRKFLDNSISDADYEELLQYFGSDMSRERLRELILQALEHDDEEKIIHIHKQKIDQTTRLVKERLSYTIDGTEPEKSSLFRRLSPYIAAAALLVIGIFSYHYFIPSTERQAPLVSTTTEDVDPGSNRAILTLSDGSVYNLSEQQDGITTDEKGIRYSDGERIIEDAEPTIVTLSTPRGGQYRIILPDGTKVFVNSASIIKYPTQFTDRNRAVELKGEAYFEVAPDHSRPFIVQSDNQQIRVLGTKFNLNSYDNEPAITTLLEGSVQIDFSGSRDPIKLRPGQQTVFKDNNIKVSEVNPQDYIGWTQDVFVFSDVPLTQIMKQLERWYDIEVHYPQNFHDTHFFAEIPRNRKLSEVLRSLEKAGNYKFEQRERRVTVRQ